MMNCIQTEAHKLFFPWSAKKQKLNGVIRAKTEHLLICQDAKWIQSSLKNERLLKYWDPTSSESIFTSLYRRWMGQIKRCSKVIWSTWSAFAALSHSRHTVQTAVLKLLFFTWLKCCTYINWECLSVCQFKSGGASHNGSWLLMHRLSPAADKVYGDF